MRSFASLTILGTLAMTGAASAQSLAEHAAAAAGATVGTAAGKPLSNALGNIFGNVDKTTSTASGKAKATAPAKAAVTKPVPDEEKIAPVGVPNSQLGPQAGPGGDGGGSGVGGGSNVAASRSGHARSARARQAAVVPEEPAAAPVAPPVPAPVVVKEPSAADLSSLQVGASEREMLAALGAPESRVSIPDDDGHLRETCQYWAQGRPLGTVRLDNGQVVQVVVRNQ